MRVSYHQLKTSLEIIMSIGSNSGNTPDRVIVREQHTPLWKNVLIVVLILTTLLAPTGVWWRMSNFHDVTLKQAQLDHAKELEAALDKAKAELDAHKALYEENIQYTLEEIAYLEEHIEFLQSQINTLQENYKQVIAALNGVRDENNALKLQLVEYKRQFDAETARLTEALAQKAEMQKKMDSLEANSKQQQQQIAGMQGQVGALQGQLADARAATKGLLGLGLLGGLL